MKIQRLMKYLCILCVFCEIVFSSKKPTIQLYGQIENLENDKDHKVENLVFKVLQENKNPIILEYFTVGDNPWFQMGMLKKQKLETKSIKKLCALLAHMEVLQDLLLHGEDKNWFELEFQLLATNVICKKQKPEMIQDLFKNDHDLKDTITERLKTEFNLDHAEFLQILEQNIQFHIRATNVFLFIPLTIENKKNLKIVKFHLHKLRILHFAKRIYYVYSKTTEPMMKVFLKEKDRMEIENILKNDFQIPSEDISQSKSLDELTQHDMTLNKLFLIFTIYLLFTAFLGSLIF